MPIQIIKHACQYCLTEFNTFADASACESLGGSVFDRGVTESQSISFESENAGLSDRWSYFTEYGIVLYKFVTSVKMNNSMQKIHTYAYVVNCNNGYERVVHDLPSGIMTSRDEDRHTVGFAQYLRDLHIKRRNGGSF